MAAPLSIPLLATQSQTLSITLGGQALRIKVYQKRFGIFVDVYSNDALVAGGVMGRNLSRIVRAAYLGFLGELTFYDTQGAADPTYDGLGTRFLLLYLS